MREFIAIIVYLSATSITMFGQDSCHCDKFKDVILDCSKKVLTSGGSIYWSLTCDSSWLTFENRNNKIILYSFDSSTIDMTGRIGTDFEINYPGLIMLRNKLISGCCEPPEFVLLNDDNADTVNFLGRILYHSTDNHNPFILKFKFHDYDHYENNDGFDFTLEILDITTGKSKYISRYSKQLRKYYQQSDMIYPEELFYDLSIEPNKLMVEIRYRDKNKWKTTKINLPK